MRPRPTLVIAFPRVSQPALLDLAVGLQGIWGCALHTAGANVLVCDPAPACDPSDAPETTGLRGTGLWHGAAPAGFDARLEVAIERRGPKWRVEVRLHQPRASTPKFQSSLGGGPDGFVRGVVRVLHALNAALDLPPLPPLGWRELLAPAQSPREALGLLCLHGAEALHVRLAQGRMGEETPRVGGHIH
jgi:hypothetical protein